MVARDDSSRNAGGEPAAAASSVGAGLFGHWRRLLGRIPGAVGRAVTGVAGAVHDELRYLTDPRSYLAENGSAIVSALGIAALALGCMLTIVLGPRFGSNLRGSVFDALWLLVWAPVRLLAMLIALHHEPVPRLRRAWAPALAPYVIAWTGLLSAVALGASAWLTFAGLRGVGCPRRESVRAVAVGFGSQAAVELVRWLAAGALFALLSVRGG